MMDEFNVAGQGSGGQTMVHPVGLAAVVLLGLALILLPRRWATLPLLAMACLVPASQRIVIATLDFNFLRILVLFGFARLLLRREYLTLTWKPLDTAVSLWAISSTFFYTLQVGTFGAFVNRLGFSFDAFGMYFLFRCLVQNWKDIETLAVACVWISIPTAFFFFLENRTSRNVFAFFGGVSEITMVRDGRLRCCGAFGNPIIAGCFWASLLPLITSLWWNSSKSKIFVIWGILNGLVIVFFSSSSTPVMGVFFALLGGLFFWLRFYLRIIRWVIVFTLFCLHLVMKAPVWHLIARVNVFSGSTGYHRYKLINEAIENFDQWWLMGCSPLTVLSWGVWAADVTNQYVLEGIRGGLATLCCFIAIIVIAFRDVGQIWRLQPTRSFRLALSWSCGVMLFVHCMNFIGVSYFGNIGILWYMSLALIGSMAFRYKQICSQNPRIVIQS